ncbi:uncharacterized protein LOC113308093 [Papaver somniferum]|uniref:uncharacterized protein LOC113308093 n=1 Tax=Papaver somniferum TaxID=3469 RepID=UPI000E6F4D26|nr:uncharacterized protein LOC113308093 [Papaver somniferum]
MQVFVINIWKVNLSLLALEEVKSLDDHVIFLGRTTVVSYSAAELGYTKGCVHFTHSDEMSLYKYEVDDKSLFLSLPCPDLPSPRFSSNWMMIPSTLRSADSIQKTHYVKCKKDEEDSSKNAEESKIGAKMVEADLIQKLNGGELMEARAWGNLLPNDIICLLGSYLHTLGYIHWRAVSKSHQSIVPKATGNRFSYNRNIRTDLTPWLVFSDDNLGVYNFLNPLHNEKYLMNIPELLKGAKIRSSKGGWLLISKGRNSFFSTIPSLEQLSNSRTYQMTRILCTQSSLFHPYPLFLIARFLPDILSLLKRF